MPLKTPKNTKKTSPDIKAQVHLHVLHYTLNTPPSSRAEARNQMPRQKGKRMRVQHVIHPASASDLLHHRAESSDLLKIATCNRAGLLQAADA
jgi:hypothetical protein